MNCACIVRQWSPNGAACIVWACQACTMRSFSCCSQAQQGQQDVDSVRRSLLLQVTQMHSGSSSAGPAALQSTASKGALPALSDGDAAAQQSAAQHSVPPDLPSGFFEAPEQAASSETPSKLPAGFFEAPGQLSENCQTHPTCIITRCSSCCDVQYHDLSACSRQGSN